MNQPALRLKENQLYKYKIEGTGQVVEKIPKGFH
jgi:hypothetical protein